MNAEPDTDCPICAKRNFLTAFILGRANTQVEPPKIEGQFAIEADQHYEMMMACLEDEEPDEPEGGLMMNG